MADVFSNPLEEAYTVRMMSWIQQLARRVASAITPDSSDGPRDPYSYVRQPLVHRPGGRNAAVALEEPDEDQNLTLIGRGRAGA